MLRKVSELHVRCRESPKKRSGSLSATQAFCVVILTTNLKLAKVPQILPVKRKTFPVSTAVQRGKGFAVLKRRGAGLVAVRMPRQPVSGWPVHIGMATSSTDSGFEMSSLRGTGGGEEGRREFEKWMNQAASPSCVCAMSAGSSGWGSSKCPNTNAGMRGIAEQGFPQNEVLLYFSWNPASVLLCC